MLHRFCKNLYSIKKCGKYIRFFFAFAKLHKNRICIKKFDYIDFVSLCVFFLFWTETLLILFRTTEKLTEKIGRIHLC